MYVFAAAMIRGNHENCCEFATKPVLRVLLEQLEVTDLTHHVLMVIQCLLSDSPEVLNLLTEDDIEVIVHLLNTNGRNSEVCWVKGGGLLAVCVCVWSLCYVVHRINAVQAIDCSVVYIQPNSKTILCMLEFSLSNYMLF